MSNQAQNDMDALRRDLQEQQRSMREQQEQQLRDAQAQRAEMARQRTESMQSQLMQQQAQASARLSAAGASGFMGGIMGAGAAFTGPAGAMNGLSLYGGRDHITPFSGFGAGYLLPFMNGTGLYQSLGHTRAYSRDRVQAQSRDAFKGLEGSLFGTLEAIAGVATAGLAPQMMRKSGLFEGAYLEMTEQERRREFGGFAEFMGAGVLSRLGGDRDVDGALIKEGVYSSESKLLGDFMTRQEARMRSVAVRDDVNLGSSAVQAELVELTALTQRATSENFGDTLRKLRGTGGLAEAAADTTRRSNRDVLANDMDELFSKLSTNLDKAGKSLVLTNKEMNAFITAANGVGMSVMDAAETLVIAGDTIRKDMPGGSAQMVNAELSRRQVDGMQRGIAPRFMRSGVAQELSGVYQNILGGALGANATAYGANANDQAAEIMKRGSSLAQTPLAELLVFADGTGSLQEQLGGLTGKSADDFFRFRQDPEKQAQVQTEGTQKVIDSVLAQFPDMPEATQNAIIASVGGLSQIDAKSARNAYDPMFGAAIDQFTTTVNTLTVGLQGLIIGQKATPEAKSPLDPSDTKGVR